MAGGDRKFQKLSDSLSGISRKDLNLREDNLNKRLYEDLVRKIDKNQDYSDLFRHMDAEAIRDIGEASAGKFARDQYGIKSAKDLPSLYEKPEILKDIDVSENPSLLEKESAHGIYYPKQKKIILPSQEDLATGIHEWSHPYDELAHGYYNLSDVLTGNKKVPKGTDLYAKGLEAAEDLNRGHFFRDDLKGLSQLTRMIKGQPLKMVAPLLKAAGVGALAASAAGIGNKALAGDFKGAAGDALDLGTDMTPILGEVKMAISPSELAEDSDKVKTPDFDFTPYKTLKQKLKTE